MDQHEHDLNFEKTLEDSKMLLDGASRALDDGYEFTLESILSEFGSEQALPDVDIASPKPAVTVTPRLEELPEDEDYVEESEQVDEAVESVVPSLDTPQSYSLQQVLERTVQDVLDSQRSEPVLAEQPKRRGLFSRKKIVETEELYQAGSVQPKPAPQPPAEEDPEEPDVPEPPVEDTVADYRAAMQNARQVARFSAIITAVMWVPQLLDHFGLLPAFYHEEPLLNTLPFFIGLALICVLGREVFFYAVEKLLTLKVTYELLTALLCLAAATDTAISFLSASRASSAALPLHSIAALSMTCALFGRSMLFKALYDSFRVVALGNPPYIVTTTAGGAAKRSGPVDGFTVTAQREDISGRWQTIVLPVILAGTVVFSILSTIEVHNAQLYFWNLSAVLSGANALAFPLIYSMPLRLLTRRFAKNGSALAGWRGADTIRRSNCLVLTDTDLFPPGTVTLNGLKIFGEESGKVFSYAATMAHASESGLSRLFDNLLEQEGGKLEILSDLNYYEEGGVGGTIHGESVLFGTASFFRKMGITLPHGLKLHTGVFLAVDGTLIAIFAVKYMAAENVDWALHALHHAHITPVLAVRDGNITPALLKRKFDTDARAVYPQLSTRLALSEKDGKHPCALIYREGLMPFAELAVGSKRLCRAVRFGNVISLLASISGALLTFYMSFVASYTQFTPFTMLVFMALWTVAALADSMFIDKY